MGGDPGAQPEPGVGPVTEPGTLAGWPAGPVRGAVAAYDTVAGYGTVRADDGREWWFHCTAIADGSRRIDEGAAVVFRVLAGHQGQAEATDLVTI